MQLDQKELLNIGKLIQSAKRVLTISHKSPDGDTLGAALGMRHALIEMDKEVTSFCIDEPASVFNFMPGVEMLTQNLGDLSTYDAIFIFDAGATHLTGLHEDKPELFDKSLPVVNIDHHVSNSFYGQHNIVVTNAASTTEVVYVMLDKLGLPVNRQTATCLLTGLYTDTGSFMHSNTTPQALRIGAKLLVRGADLRSLSKDIFNTTPVSTMHLWGRVLKSIHQTPDGVTMAVVSKKDFEEVGADYSQLEGVVDYVNSVPGAQYSVLLSERDEAVKGSLRTLKDEVDVAAIAGGYGGGGHTKAAGFTVKGQLQKEVKWTVVGEE